MKHFTERAECHDCEFLDIRLGARGRGAQHASRTGHEVQTRKVTTYHRQGPIEGQTSIYDMDVPDEREAA